MKFMVVIKRCPLTEPDFRAGSGRETGLCADICTETAAHDDPMVSFETE
jgi:hypothetical protein